MNTGLCVYEISDSKDLICICKGQKVFLYGAGVRAASVCELFKDRGISISGFLVSSRNGNEPIKNGYPVIQANEFNVPDSIIVFAIDVKSKDKCHEIVDPKIEKIYFMEESLYSSEFCTYFHRKLSKAFPEEAYRIFADGKVEKNYLLCQYNNFVFRVPPAVLAKDGFNRLKIKFSAATPDVLFKKYYRQFYYLHAGEKGRGTSSKTYSVYMARCHLDHDISMPDIPEWLIPIQTGAALTDKTICTIKDNQGDNISGRNRDYSECTAIYWIWKNAPKTDYIGLCHYRRHFDIPNDDISVIEINGYDIVAVVPTAVVNNHECFRQFVTEEDIHILKESVGVLFQDYYPLVGQYLENSFCPPCNMTIMRYDIFMEYAEYVFRVTERIHHYYVQSDRIRNDRYMGFLVEILTGIFIAKSSVAYKIGYTNMKFLG